MSELTKDQQKAILTKFYRAIGVMRNINASIPSQTIAVLIQIALHEGDNVKAIGEFAGFNSESSASRNIAALTDLNHRQQPGYKLAEYRENRESLRLKDVHLTARGREAINQIIFILSK